MPALGATAAPARAGAARWRAELRWRQQQRDVDRAGRSRPAPPAGRRRARGAAEARGNLRPGRTGAAPRPKGAAGRVAPQRCATGRRAHSPGGCAPRGRRPRRASPGGPGRHLRSPAPKPPRQAARRAPQLRRRPEQERAARSRSGSWRPQDVRLRRDVMRRPGATRSRRARVAARRARGLRARPCGGRDPPARPRSTTSGCARRSPATAPGRVLPCWSGRAHVRARTTGSASPTARSAPCSIIRGPPPGITGRRRSSTQTQILPHHGSAVPRAASQTRSAATPSGPTGRRSARASPPRRSDLAKHASAERAHSHAPRPGRARPTARVPSGRATTRTSSPGSRRARQPTQVRLGPSAPAAPPARGR